MILKVKQWPESQAVMNKKDWFFIMATEKTDVLGSSAYAKILSKNVIDNAIDYLIDLEQKIDGPELKMIYELKDILCEHDDIVHQSAEIDNNIPEISYYFSCLKEMPEYEPNWDNIRKY